MCGCFAPGCKTGYKKNKRENKEQGKRNPTLFSAPKDIEVLQKWQRAIPRKDRVFTVHSKLCELHFEEDCIIRTFDTKINGSIFAIERDRFSLKPGSVPTIFPNCPAYFTKRLKKRKAHSSQNETCPRIYYKMPTKDPLQDLQLPTFRKKTYSRRKSTEDLLLDPQATSQNETYSRQNPIEDLLPDSNQNQVTAKCQEIKSLDLSLIVKPNKYWSICKDDDGCVLCFKRDAYFHCQRHVVIAQDFSVKVFLWNKEISSKRSRVYSEQDLSLLLKEIDELNIYNFIKIR